MPLVEIRPNVLVALDRAECAGCFVRESCERDDYWCGDFDDYGCDD